MDHKKPRQSKMGGKISPLYPQLSMDKEQIEKATKPCFLRKRKDFSEGRTRLLRTIYGGTNSRGQDWALIKESSLPSE